MAKAKEEKANGLKTTNGTFEIVGRISLGLDKFSGATSDSGYEWQRFSTNIDCGDTRPFISCMGGYMNSNPFPLKFWDNGNEFEVDWEDRFNEEIISKISNYSKVTLAVSKDDMEKVEYVDFLSWYDAIEYLKEVCEDDEQEFKDGSIVKIKGDVKWQEYQDSVSYQLEAKKIFLVDAEEEDFHATFKQVILLDKNSIVKDRWAKDKEVDVYASMISYDSKEKEKRPFKTRYVVKLEDYKTKEQFQKMLKLLGAKPKEVTEIEVTGNVLRSSSLRNATLDDFDEDMLDFYEDDVDELLEEKIVDGGDTANYLTITRPAARMDKETKKKSLHRKTDTYSLEDLIFVKKEQEVENIDDVLDSDDLDLDDLDLDDL